ncbi:MAG: hypothetical protein Fur0014_21750 [Rubrivivax sp.]
MRHLLIPLLGALALSACAGLPAARMVLPVPLADQRPETLAGLSGGTRGEFRLPGAEGRYERSATRLDLFEAVRRDRASARTTLRWADGREARLDCVGRELSARLGALAGRVQPWALRCEGGPGTVLELSDPGGVTGAKAGTRAERQGRLDFPGGQLVLRSVHRVEGSPLPLEAPIGYVVTHGGRPVGAVELNGLTPRLWRPPAGDPLHEPVTLVLLALALVWDPA